MTIAKSIIRILLFAACLAAMLLCCACSNEENDALSNLDKIGGGEKTATVSVYQIVLPSRSGAELALSADKLATAITENTGVRSDIYYDNEVVPYAADAIAVLVGNTKYSDSALYIHSLRRDDYVCRASARSIVIGGKSDSACVAAIEYLVEEILPYRESQTLMDDGDGFEYYAEYEFASLALCGTRLGSYGIVCTLPRGSAEANMTSALRERIADRCGEYPELYFAEQGTDGVRELIITQDASGASNAKIAYDGEDVVLTARDTYGISVAMEKLYAEMFCSVSDGKASFDITSEKNYSYVQPKISINSLTARIDRCASLVDRALILAGATANCDVVCFGKLNAEAWDIVKNNLNNSYTPFCFDVGGGECVAFAYDGAKLSLDAQSPSLVRQGECLLAQLGFVMGGESIKICLLIGTASEVSDAQLSAVKQCVLDKNAYTAALLTLSGGAPYDVSVRGISTVYNELLTVNSQEYRACMLTDGSRLSASDVLIGKNSFFASVKVELCGTVSDGFAALLR